MMMPVARNAGRATENFFTFTKIFYSFTIMLFADMSPLF
jgi:hypothetical protein